MERTNGKERRNDKKLRKIKTAKGILYIASSMAAIYKASDFILRRQSNKVAQSNSGTEENKIGYEDVNVVNNKIVHTNNFVIFHINRDADIVSLREKMEFCQNNNISMGVVLDTNASNLSTIYKDVDFLQAVVKEYKIDLPVYCNIDSMMNNTALNNAQKVEIMKAFIDKMSRSDMYFGFSGTDTNLKDCKEYVLDLDLYDCFLVQDSEDIKYNGTYNLKKDLNNNISANFDLSKVIIEGGFNNSKKLVFSAHYKVQKNDTYHSLALKFGLSEEDLREYNNNDKEELKVGQTIAIPNLYKSVNNVNNKVEYNYAIARGIDISDYQSNINWNRVAKTSDFVIVEVARNGYNCVENSGSYIPECISQVENVINKDIALGLYFCISSDMKVSIYEQRLELYLTRFEKELKEKNITLDYQNIPVFLDFEVYNGNNNYYKLMETFEKVCNKHGFTKIGIYANASTLKSISSSLMKDGKHIELNDTNWYVWQSGGKYYSSHENTDSGYKLNEIEDYKNEANNQYTPTVLQVTNVCKDTGAANFAGNCDVNFCYSKDIFGNSFNADVEDTIETIVVDLNKYTNYNVNNVINGTLNALISLGVAVLAIEATVKTIKMKICKRKNAKKENNVKGSQKTLKRN